MPCQVVQSRMTPNILVDMSKLRGVAAIWTSHGRLDTNLGARCTFLRNDCERVVDYAATGHR